MVDAICAEIALQKDYLATNTLSTIYFGGGTPSLLNQAELAQIFAQIHRYFEVLPEAEITLEANPEDITEAYVDELCKQGINRLSIGVQSFDSKNAKLLHRNHDAETAINAIQIAQAAGITNISIDLIYGIPGNSLEDLTRDIDIATSTGVTHISAYCLMIEPKTVFGHQKRKGLFIEMPENEMAEAFAYTRKALAEKGYEAYETSNFARDGHYSKHNTSYWQQTSYLGVGPAAHSFNQGSRQWNIANNATYIKSIQVGKIPAEIEELTPANQLNEYVMTQLRTKWGIDMAYFQSKLGELNEVFPDAILNHWIKQGWAIRVDERLQLTHTGHLIADKLASDLFIVYI